jgi:hypothetical protein
MALDSLPPGAERRVAPRRDVKLPIFCRIVADDGPVLSALVLDLSQSGAGLELPSWLPRNQELHLGFTGGGAGLTVRAIVRFARPADPPQWRIGCEFGQPLSVEEFAAIVAGPKRTVNRS